MKKLFLTTAVMLPILFAACKKDTKEEDIATLFQNTIWTGEIKYSVNPFPEPYSVTFNGLGGLLWEDRLGASNGSYILDKVEKTIVMNLGKGAFKATISNRKFSNITVDVTYPWKVNSGELNNESGQSLANTLWKGTQTAVPNVQQPYQMNFMIEPKINFNGGPDNYPYIKSGVTIRLDFTTWGYFFVLLPQNKLKGIFWDSFSTPGNIIYRSYDMTKQ